MTRLSLGKLNPTAYHGSQARFTAFTVDGVGKGHGMGYGWGVYLTSDIATASAYAGVGGAIYTAKIPRGPWMPWKGRTVSPSMRRLYKKVVSSLRHVTEPCSTHGTRASGEEAYQRLNADRFQVAGGYLYHVIADLLGDYVGDKTSRLLRSHGILGIVYTQPRSRLSDGSETPEGATNYVVFDPKDIRIVDTVSRSNPPLGNSGSEFKKAAALKLLRRVIYNGGGNVDAAEDLAEKGFQFLLNNLQKHHMRIIPRKDYPGIWLQSVRELIRMLESGELNK